MNELSHLPKSDHAIRTLHAEIEKLASTAASAYRNPNPIRTEQQGDSTLQWFYDGIIKVFVCDGGVFMAGDERYNFNWWPDWCAMPRNEVRTIANAMLSAAAYVDGLNDPHTPGDPPMTTDPRQSPEARELRHQTDSPGR